MASAASSSPSSSSQSSTQKKYHVFISFRGEDTRKTFTSHLYHAFSVKKINAYIDEESLRKGDEISPSLLEAIEESKISVVILSENYGSSRWCLDELNHILLCKETDSQIVVPVFYDVDPSNVRKQKGSYASAFTAHEVRFKDQTDKVQQWRSSLARVADLSGFDSSNFGSDSLLVEAILRDVMKKLDSVSPCQDYCKDLVGIEKRIEHVEAMLNISSSDVRILAYRFEACYFLENVKQESKRDGLAKLKERLFSEILLEKQGLNVASQFVKHRLSCTKVFIVLDDIDDAEQLEYLAGNRDWFSAGSRIIVTTRDLEVLTCIQADETYEVEKLNSHEALQLLCSKAFRRNSPISDYVYLSERVVSYAKGIPLALKVLGLHLYSKSINEWESAVDKLKKDPNKKIYDVLKISYDGLEENEQQIFLDIACFFKGYQENLVKKILLDVFGRYVDIGIAILLDRSLITLGTYNTTIEMHDLLQQMGRRIVHEESNKPGKRSRLCLTEDIHQVLKHNTGTQAIQGMALATCELRDSISLKPHVFRKMYNLKFIDFCNRSGDSRCYLNLPHGLESLPDELGFLRWDYYPLKSLPSDFLPSNIVQMDLRDSQIEHLWEGVQNFGNLKALDLSGSKNLIQIPNLSQAMKLEDIHLSYCPNINKFPELPANVQQLGLSGTSIEQVPPSIECLSHLKNLQLHDCEKLKSLPSTIWKLKSLRRLGLECCSELQHLPEILEPMENLTELEITESGIKELPSSIKNLIGLYSLDLSNCKNFHFIPHFEDLPPSSTGLLFLKNINLDNTSVSEIPDWIFCLPILDELSLRRTMIGTLPASIKSSKLRKLYVRGCESLQSLPELPLCIKIVDASGCRSLGMVSNPSFEALTQEPWKTWTHEDCSYNDDFKYNGCFMLDVSNIITEFHIRALRLGIGYELVSEEIKLQQKAPGVCFALSGDEIPSWFNYQNDDGSSINVKLDPQPYDTTNFMGFASCLVASFNKIGGSACLDDPIGFQLQCNTAFITNDGKRRHYFGRPLFFYGLRNDSGTNLFLGYFHMYGANLSSVKEISVDFETKIDLTYNHLDLKVKRCGIRMLYLQDAREFGIISSDFVLPGPNFIFSIAEPNEVEIIDLDVDEPPPKRTKFSSFP
ncbi:TIR-NBS-LRR-like protein [Trema orientale]|uniref:ADP-ribosyl cyclase/cyclic ADP-ribose hydrolase n=1 Tax=Trema orientale TaxID=63057 RepID=A0A2P5EQE6_TREOI|nr:TIR-NBS-LRR-like protein [Trema orientale]